MVLLHTLTFGGMSIFEKTEDRLYPFRANKEKFVNEYKKLLTENPKQKKEVFMATIAAFKLTDVEMDHLEGLAIPKRSEKDSGKGVITPPQKHNPLDFIYRMPHIDPPTVTPPNATSE